MPGREASSHGHRSGRPSPSPCNPSEAQIKIPTIFKLGPAVQPSAKEADNQVAEPTWSELMEQEVTTQHAYHDSYAATEDQMPESAAGRAEFEETLQKIHDFRCASIEWMRRPESLTDYAAPESDMAMEFEDGPRPGINAIYVVTQNRGMSYVCMTCHRELPAHDRPDLLFTHLSRFSYDTKTQRFTVMGEHLPGDVLIVEELQQMSGLLPEDFHVKPEELLNDSRRPYWFIARYRTVERVLSAPQPFMELGRDYDITKKKRVVANGLMRPVLIRTQQLIPLQRNPGMVVALLPQLMPLQLGRGIRPGHHRQRVMRLTAALSQGWMVHPVAKEVLPWKDSRHEMLRAAPQLCAAYQHDNTRWQAIRFKASYGVYAQIAIEAIHYDYWHYTTTITRVTQGDRCVLATFAIAREGQQVTLGNWKKHTQATMELPDGRAVQIAIEFAVSEGFGARITARMMTLQANDPLIGTLEQQTVTVYQNTEVKEHMVLHIPKGKQLPSTESSAALSAYAAINGGNRIEMDVVQFNEERIKVGNFTLSKQQSDIAYAINSKEYRALALDCGFGVGKTLTAIVAAVSRVRENPSNIVIFTGSSNAVATAAVGKAAEVDPQLRFVRIISQVHRNRVEEELRTEFDFPVLWRRIFGRIFTDHNVPGMHVSAINMQAIRLYLNHTQDQRIANSVIKRGLLPKNIDAAEELTLWECFYRIYQPRILMGTTTAILSSARSAELDARKDLVDLVMIDEASQLPLASFAALATTFTKAKMVLIGDRHQLPPYADRALPQLLKKASIGTPLSDAIDNRAIPSLPLTEVRRCPQQITNLLGHTQSGPTLINEGEAALASKLATRLKQVFPSVSIGLLTFYSGQHGLLASRLVNQAFISTIDGVQGKEFDITIVCFTRSTGYRNSQFLDDRHRITVAISRTKKACFVIRSYQQAQTIQNWNSIFINEPDMVYQAEELTNLDHADAMEL
uniref:AAA_12 domain-containing protein n=1 Tax=Caenorhabditis japonica TaxID=281687 RepID=A0A8R1E3P1_CAEJA